MYSEKLVSISEVRSICSMWYTWFYFFIRNETELTEQVQPRHTGLFCDSSVSWSSQLLSTGTSLHQRARFVCYQTSYAYCTLAKVHCNWVKPSLLQVDPESGILSLKKDMCSDTM